MTLAPKPASPERDGAGQPAPPDPEFEALLDYLKRSRGFDFLGYKRASLMRRVRREMQSVEVESFSDYMDYLEVHPDGFERLFNTVLINVTGFFRDAAAWEALSEEVLPRLLAAKPGGEPLRLWSAGCASGQEAYSLAIALAEQMGLAAFRDRVKIYATDVDEEALAQARSAVYTAREVQGLSPALLEKYFENHFEADGDRHVFRKDLRRALIFGRHDLLRDAPISRIDLLACRNTVMYFNAEVQAQILSRFHFAVNDGGYLFLGKAEMLFSHGSLFVPLDLKRRIFFKVPQAGPRERTQFPGQTDLEAGDSPLDSHLRLRETVFATGPVAQIVVDRQGILVMVNERARALFRLTARDLGRPLRDLEISYRPAELRSCIEQAVGERRPVLLQEVSYTSAGGETLYLDTTVVPLQAAGATLGVGISFADVTRTRQMSEDLQKVGRELETAYEELQSTNEELETTNEELQSTVEELETTNEELQSTNEELETTNEELQATNEELQTINDEMRLRSDLLNQANAFLNSVLTGLQSSVIVLDTDLHVQIWNSRSEEFWGLRAAEAQGKPFLTLDFGLPTAPLLPAIRACLADPRRREEAVLPARNRRGRDFSCRVSVSSVLGGDGEMHGVLLLADTMLESVLNA